MKLDINQTIARHNCRFYRDLLGEEGFSIPISNLEISALSDDNAILLECGLFSILCVIPEEACDE